jgi:peptide/nickel transport system permease protein
MKLTAVRPLALMLMRETVITALLLLGVSIVVFVILHLSPGDPFSSLFEGQTGGPRDEAEVSSAFGVPAAWHARYFSWLANMLAGNFGSSIRTGLPVLNEIVRVGINTLYLTLGAMFITLAVAVPTALLSARRGLTPTTWSLTMFSYVISALPVFWLGYIAIYLFTRKLGLFPVAFGASESRQLNWLYFLLPIFVLGLGNGTTSEVVRYLREEMTRVFSEDYIRTARAKGASVWRHSFKEGFLIPISEIIASKIPFMLGGAVVVEQVFNWPGMGRMAWQAAQDRDYPVIMGITILAAVIVRLGNLVQRVVYVLANPRASQDEP